MNAVTFRIAVAAIGVAFAATFAVVVGPALLADRDPVAGLAAGFVNPYAAGFSHDTIACWLILTCCVLYERVRFGWLAILLGAVPGVATGFAVYLLLRQRSAS